MKSCLQNWAALPLTPASLGSKCSNYLYVCNIFIYGFYALRGKMEDESRNKGLLM